MTTPVARASSLVVKVGSSLVTDDGRGLDHDAVARWAAQIADLRRRGMKVVLVSSGAIAEGVKRLGWGARPSAMHELQAAAAVGQMGLVQMWESCFSEVGLHTAQVLLTHEDLGDRHRYLNARTTLKTLVARGAAGDPAMEAMAGGAGSAIGSGGMITKVLAAKRAARSGAHTAIAWGREPDVLVRLFAGEAIGTLLEAQTQPVAARKQWLADHLKPSGRIVLDAGAVKALVADGKSLLAIGATAVDGHFGRGEVVSVVGPDGREIARGLVNYGSAETARILRKPTAEIESVLGYLAEPELIHRDNLVVL